MLARQTLGAFKALLVVAVFLTLAVPATADDMKAGTVRIESTSVAIGIGVTWGEGQLTLNDGSVHRFDVNGLSVIDVGISSVTASGNVYNLTKIEDFAGTYVSGQAGAAVGGGASAQRMKNDKGVVIELNSAQAGVRLTLAPEGVTIALK